MDEIDAITPIKRITIKHMHNPDSNDLEDVGKILAGETELFSRLLERHGEAVAKQMRNFSNTPTVIEELTHDVFVEAYVNLANYRGDAPFRHWLARIATITGYRYWKTRERRNREVVFEEEAEHESAKPESTVHGNPEAAGELLHEMLAELPDADRMILVMMYVERCGQREIASRLGCSKTAAAVRIFRAKRKLKKLGEVETWRRRAKWMIS